MDQSPTTMSCRHPCSKIKIVYQIPQKDQPEEDRNNSGGKGIADILGSVLGWLRWQTRYRVFLSVRRKGHQVDRGNSVISKVSINGTLIRNTLLLMALAHVLVSFVIYMKIPDRDDQASDSTMLRPFLRERNTASDDSPIRVQAKTFEGYSFNRKRPGSPYERISRQIKSGRITNLSQLGYSARPTIFAYNLNWEILHTAGLAVTPGSQTPKVLIHGALPHDTNLYVVYPTKHEVEMSSRDIEAQKYIRNSEENYNAEFHRKYDVYKNFTECQPMHEWQTRSFPACNSVHELDSTDLSYERNKYHRQVRLLAHGYWRDVWVIRDHDQTRRVMKTIRYQHDHDERNFERHRMDAVVMERLTSSPHIVDIYGFCGHTGVFEYGYEGAIDNALFEGDRKLTSYERLRIAVQVSQALSDLHNFNHKAPAVVHGDIMVNQFIKIDGVFKLNDFNRCHFMYWNTTSDSGSCPYYYPDGNAWIFRSPEEYYYDLQTEEIDVYSMGNIIYVLLMELWPFEELEAEGGSSPVRKRVRKGIRPPLDDRLLESDDPSIIAMLHAMRMCWIHEWRERATAMQVRDYLVEELEKIDELDQSFREREMPNNLTTFGKHPPT